MVRRKELIAASILLLLILSCRQQPKKAPASGTVPLVEVDVITMRSTQTPEKRQRLSNIIISADKVRFADELDTWRLIDLTKGTVTLVDMVGESYRTVSFEDLAAEKRSKAAMPLPPFVKPATIASTGRTETINGVEASEWLITMGSFRRELWLSTRPVIHPRFLSLSIGSEELGGNYAAAMAPVHMQLMSLQGFPVRDVISFPAGDKNVTLERRFEKRARQRVPRALLEIPKNFEDLTRGSGGDLPSSSSSPAGQDTRAAGSRSSARSERTP